MIPFKNMKWVTPCLPQFFYTISQTNKIHTPVKPTPQVYYGMHAYEYVRAQYSGVGWSCRVALAGMLLCVECSRPAVLAGIRLRRAAILVHACITFGNPASWQPCSAGYAQLIVFGGAIVRFYDGLSFRVRPSVRAAH